MPGYSIVPVKTVDIMVEFFKSVYYWIAVGVVSVASFIFYPCRAYGRENVPKKGGCIFASNHESNIDPILLPVVSPRQMRFMAKDSLFAHPVLGLLISLGGGFPVKRFSADRGALNEFIRQIRLGYPVLIFPQGTRGGAKIQAGVGFLAAQTGAPVVPIYIEGTAKVLPKGARLPKRTPVAVTFGQPFMIPRDMPYAEAAAQVMEKVYALAR